MGVLPSVRFCANCGKRLGPGPEEAIPVNVSAISAWSERRTGMESEISHVYLATMCMPCADVFCNEIRDYLRGKFQT
jgi:hypothetical protein